MYRKEVALKMQETEFYINSLLLGFRMLNESATLSLRMLYGKKFLLSFWPQNQYEIKRRVIVRCTVAQF
jgi:hypothetical protein